MVTPKRGALLHVLPPSWGYDVTTDEYVDPRGNRISGFLLEKLIEVGNEPEGIPMPHEEPSKFGSRVANSRVKIEPIEPMEAEERVPCPGRVVRIKWNWEPQRKLWAEICETGGRQPEVRIEAPQRDDSKGVLSPKHRAILRSLSV